MQRISPGLDLKKSLKLAERLGCKVAWPNRTGEVTVRHDGLGQGVRVNSRRKDSPRCLTNLLNDVLSLAA